MKKISKKTTTKNSKKKVLKKTSTSKKKVSKKKRNQMAKPPRPKASTLAKGDTNDILRSELFAAEYVKDLNGTAAAKRAGYSQKTAGSTASRLLAKAEIQDLVLKEFEKRKRKVNISAETVLRELHHIATANISEAFDENGCVLPITEFPEYLARAVSGFEVYEEKINGIKVGVTKKVKFWEKTKSLDLIGKHLAMWITRIEGSDKHGNRAPLFPDTIRVEHDAYKRIGENELRLLAGVVEPGRN